MTSRILKAIGAWGAFLALSAPASASAAQSPTSAVNPVEQASFHQLVFADEDVAILDNRYPPRGDSGFHAHQRDLFAVVIQSSSTSGQAPGKPLVAAPPYPVGAIAYGAVGAEPRVHRIVNSDEGEFQAIVIELRRAQPRGTNASSRDSAPQYEQVADHPRLRAWRLVLEPGQSVPAISQGDKGVRVVVRGGLLTTMVAGAQDQILALQPGDVAIQPAGTRRALKNSGTGTLELVEIELK